MTHLDPARSQPVIQALCERAERKGRAAQQHVFFPKRRNFGQQVGNRLTLRPRAFFGAPPTTRHRPPVRRDSSIAFWGRLVRWHDVLAPDDVCDRSGRQHHRARGCGACRSHTVSAQPVTFRIRSWVKNLQARSRLKERSGPSKEIRSAVKMQKRSNDVPPGFATAPLHRKEGANRARGVSA